MPISRGSIQGSPPSSGIPRRVNAVLNFADSAANRMSQDTARISPTPAQAP